MSNDVEVAIATIHPDFMSSDSKDAFNSDSENHVVDSGERHDADSEESHKSVESHGRCVYSGADHGNAGGIGGNAPDGGDGGNSEDVGDVNVELEAVGDANLEDVGEGKLDDVGEANCIDEVGDEKEVVMGVRYLDEEGEEENAEVYVLGESNAGVCLGTTHCASSSMPKN